MRKSLTLALLPLMIVAFLALSVPKAQAYSNANVVYLPGTSIRLQANAASDSWASNHSFYWATSSKTTVNGYARYVSTIKNTPTLRAEGVMVSISNGGVSGSTGVVSEVTLSWTNNNAWISDLSGRTSWTGVLWRFTVYSFAFAFTSGVKNTVGVWSW